MVPIYGGGPGRDMNPLFRGLWSGTVDQATNYHVNKRVRWRKRERECPTILFIITLLRHRQKLLKNCLKLWDVKYFVDYHRSLE